MNDSAPPSSESSAEAPAGPRVGRGRLVVISGPSGVGKNTVVRGLSAHRSFHFSVSATTRPARPDEVDGFDYQFIDQERFSSMIRENRLIEWAEFAGNRYGTPRDQVFGHLEAGRDVVLDIELNGAFQVMDEYPDVVSIFLMPPSIDELEARMRGRMGMSEAQIVTRLKLAEEQIEAGWHRFRFVVVNEDLDTTIAAIMDILG